MDRISEIQHAARHQEALPLWREALLLQDELFGDAGKRKLHLLTGLANCLTELQLYDEASPYWQQAVEVSIIVFGTGNTTSYMEKRLARCRSASEAASKA